MADNDIPNLSGSWYGNYYYASSSTAYGFEVVFIENGGHVSGNILDLGVKGEANVSGTFSYPTLCFTKIYYSKASSPVIYEGTMSSDGKTLTGKWEIPPMAKGGWMAWRVEEKEEFDQTDTETDKDLEAEEETPKVQVATAAGR
jgi:hypothetical protein